MLSRQTSSLMTDSAGSFFWNCLRSGFLGEGGQTDVLEFHMQEVFAKTTARMLHCSEGTSTLPIQPMNLHSGAQVVHLTVGAVVWGWMTPPVKPPFFFLREYITLPPKAEKQ
jgi:hypothetical protein